MTNSTLDVVLLWHMHQPDYRDPETGVFREPWVYLHALKDYVDMVGHLERHPDVRACINLVPSLLDQIEDYAEQCAAGVPRDDLLRALLVDDLGSLPPSARQALANACLRMNEATMLEPFPAYRMLAQLKRQCDESGTLDYLSGQYLADLVTWYHLAWTGETLRRSEPLIQRLLKQGRLFSAADRRALFEFIGRVLGELIGRYRALQERGQVELTTTPQRHPLAPLLLDFASAREAQPSIDLPRARQYPGGKARVEAQLRDGLASHARRFGTVPDGVWPAEGAISAPLMELFGQAGVRWVASGGGVLRHSIEQAGATQWSDAHCHQLYRIGEVACLFRDDRLSDLIGFEYAKWHSGDAAQHLLGELDRLAQAPSSATAPVVGIVLDGENAWEYYPYNAYYFFEALYAGLGRHAQIRTQTVSRILDRPDMFAGLPPVPKLVAGSWVYGTFSTWIGAAEKNRAWDLLCAAKTTFDQTISARRLSSENIAAAERLLANCESSDWFWWFGDYNPSEAVATFDRLFRGNLERLYMMLGVNAPAALAVPLASGGGHPDTGGTMRRAA